MKTIKPGATLSLFGRAVSPPLNHSNTTEGKAANFSISMSRRPSAPAPVRPKATVAVNQSSFKDGQASLKLLIRHGKHRYQVICAKEGTFYDVKLLLQQVVAGAPSQQKLIYKGKVRKNDETLQEANIFRSGAKLMLLFESDYHNQQTGGILLTAVTAKLERLERMAQSTQAKLSHRLFEKAELALQLAAIDDTLQTLLHEVDAASCSVERQGEADDTIKRLKVLVKQIDGLKKEVLRR